MSPSQLDALLEYVETQEEHLVSRTFQEEYREFLHKYGVEYDDALCRGRLPKQLFWMNRAFSAGFVCARSLGRCPRLPIMKPRLWR